MKRAIIYGVTLLLLFSMITGCNSTKNSTDYGVTIVSGKVEHTPIEQWIYSLSDGVAADGTRKQPQEVKYELVEITVSGDFEIKVTGNVTGQPSYTLFYDDSFETVYYRNDRFERPNDIGRYILCIEVAFGNDKEYEGYQYWFRIAV